MNLEIGNTSSVNLEIGQADSVKLETGSSVNGVTNYNSLTNIPKINDVELKGNRKSSDLKLQDEMKALTNLEIKKLIGE